MVAMPQWIKFCSQLGMLDFGLSIQISQSNKFKGRAQLYSVCKSTSSLSLPGDKWHYNSVFKVVNVAMRPNGNEHLLMNDLACCSWVGSDDILD